MTNTISQRVLFQVAILLSVASPADNVKAEGTTSVYRCNLNGVTTFSDRPCDATAQVHEIETAGMNTFEPLPVGKSAPLSRKATRKTVGDMTLNPSKHKANCERLNRSLKEVRSKTRSGYKASEGERLRAREDKLKSQLRFSKCR